MSYVSKAVVAGFVESCEGLEKWIQVDHGLMLDNTVGEYVWKCLFNTKPRSSSSAVANISATSKSIWNFFVCTMTTKWGSITIYHWCQFLANWWWHSDNTCQIHTSEKRSWLLWWRCFWYVKFLVNWGMDLFCVTHGVYYSPLSSERHKSYQTVFGFRRRRKPCLRKSCLPKID